MFDFDLQTFADEENVETGTTQTEENSQEENVEEIPQELEGLSEEIAREAMQNARELEETEQNDAEENQQENKTEDFSHSGKVPYPRLKEQIDKTNALKAELAAYRQRFGDIKAPIQQAPQPQFQQPQQQAQAQQVPPPNPQVSPDVAKRIKKAINDRAKQISGLTDEDIDALEYMDDDDERIDQWKSASEMAKNEVYGAIQKAQTERVQAAKAFLEEHQRNVNSFNEYVAKEAQNKDFQAIQTYAVDDKNGFATRLSDNEKMILQSAYARTQQGVASPQDYYMVRNFYEQAKADFYNKRGNAKKINVPKAHPRSEMITGGADTGGVTAEELQAMLDTKEWDKIPQVYRDMMLGLTT